MATLSKEHRKLLENTVAAARKIAVAGAEKALLALRVGDKEAPSDPGQKELRSQLRAHGRQLGDRRQPNGTQETVRLEQAFAYEHWHRLLFARFLAENDLLVNPEFGVPMSLAEVQETAREKGCDWLTLASGYAQQMLLEVFRPDDPVLRVALPPETRQLLDEKLASLPFEIFRADDSLGWVYQSWQRDEKERVNESEVKIGADELPAVTQLFTEDYMVLFLLENTLGAWWTAKRRKEGKDSTLPGYKWTYLRLNADGSPVAGDFEGWPQAVRNLRVLDPSMGSGHFLTFALPVLARMRMEEENVGLRDAVYSVLRDNLFGLELDARCSQIAAFNLALSAWRMVGAHSSLPALNLACSGLGINAPEIAWVELAGEDGLAREEMRRLYSLFKDAPTLGSLIDPLRLQASVFTSGAEHVLPFLEGALGREQLTAETRELAVAARGILVAFRILANRFTLVVTNVPYLGRGKQASILANYCSEFHADTKGDLATCFLDRCLSFCAPEGTAALVTPQDWHFKTRYKTARERLLRRYRFDLVVQLGTNAFQDMNWWAANTSLVTISNCSPETSECFFGLNTEHVKDQREKALSLQTQVPVRLLQSDQLKTPDARIVLGALSGVSFLSVWAESRYGLRTGDLERLAMYFWELPSILEGWVPFQGTVRDFINYGGRETVLLWNGGAGPLRELADEGVASVQGADAWGKTGIAVSLMGRLPITIYTGEVFDNGTGVIWAKDQRDLPAILAFCRSPQFFSEVRKIDQAVKVTNQTLLKVPFDHTYWTEIARQEYQRGIPSPASDDPTQWLFDGYPGHTSRILDVAVARLCRYKWPRQTGSEFPGCGGLGPDGLEPHTDADGIVGLNAISGDGTAADQLRFLLKEVYGKDWSAAKLGELVGDCGSLELWLRDRFFEAHCQIFQQRPFIWHIWDGRKDGFHALVNYHKLAEPLGEGRKTLEKLIYTSLGDWIRRQEDEVKGGADGAEARLTAALHLKAELINILRGEPPYDLFIRWKPLHQQPMGWDPDINDGVRLNMRPWLNAKPYVPPGQKQKQDACILRVTPIKLPIGKDRGKEPLRDKDDFPWYATSQDRTNDLHFTLEEKRAARERKKKA